MPGSPPGGPGGGRSSHMRLRAFSGLVLAALLVVLGTVGCGNDDNDKTLTVVTHDSFNLSEDLIKQFEKDHGVTVKLLPKGDAGAMLTTLILTKKDPEGDV